MLDHRFNVQSAASIYAVDKTIEIYGFNEEYSFYDNIDILSPDIILINTHYYDYDHIQDSRIKKYNIPYFLHNFMIKTNQHKTEEKYLLILDQNEPLTINRNKPILYKNTPIKIASIEICENGVGHYQYIGYIKSSKDLHDIVNENTLILSNTRKVLSISNSLKKRFGIYKERGTISIEDPNETANFLNNKDFIEKYVYG